jgi:hypothetical protein
MVKQAPWVVQVVLESKLIISKGMDPYFNVLDRKPHCLDKH